MKLTITLFTTALLAFSGAVVPAMCNGTEFDAEATMAGLQQALNTSDISGLQAIYSEQAMVIPVNQQIINNLDSISRFWDNRLSEGRSFYNIEVIDLQVENNIAYISALWSATVTIDGAYTEIRDGYVSNILERSTDGDWKIRIQDWN